MKCMYFEGINEYSRLLKWCTEVIIIVNEDILNRIIE